MLEIKLGRLKHDSGFTQPVQAQTTCGPAAYGYADICLKEPLIFTGQAQHQAGEIWVEGQVTACLALVCSRCGAEFPLRMELPFAEVYTAEEVSPDAEGEQDKHSFSGDSIDIMPEALRLLFEQLPMKPLCREDCRGLCPTCGEDLNQGSCGCQNQNIDPRWEKLRDLLPDDFGKGV